MLRITRDSDLIRRAQQLRYDVFCREMRGEDISGPRSGKLDADAYDAHCRHLVVIDPALPDEVIGTYRLIDSAAAVACGGFYSQAEFNLDPLLARAEREQLNLIEVGRSCVHPNYRAHSVMQMLWRALAGCCFRENVDVMFGCASFAGNDVSAIAPALRLLHDRHAAGPEWGVRARPEYYVPLDQAPSSEGAVLPPLVKGYLRLGAAIADGAVIDTAFGSIDVCILLAVNQIPARYAKLYRP